MVFSFIEIVLKVKLKLFYTTQFSCHLAYVVWVRRASELTV